MSLTTPVVPRRLTLPLSDVEILKLKKGKEVRKCFHVGRWKGLAIVHSDGFDHLQAIERFEEARKDGHDILNAPLDKDNLEQLFKGAVRCSYAKDTIEMTITSQRVHDQVMAEIAQEQAKKTEELK